MTETANNETNLGTMNVEQAAAFLEMKVNTLKRLVREKIGPKSARIARELKFREADLRDWVKQQFEKPAKVKTPSRPKKEAAAA